MRRVQRKRTKGWKMPENAIYVGRPSRWGNLYPVTMGRMLCLKLYEVWLIEQIERDPHFLEPLRGKDLACWCRLDQPCHADVIMRYLNK